MHNLHIFLKLEFRAYFIPAEFHLHRVLIPLLIFDCLSDLPEDENPMINLLSVSEIVQYS